MNQQLYVLLYSKYSPHSVNLLNYISSAPINLSHTIGLNMLCIDNEDVRNRIKNTKAIQISVVPSVLVVYPTGGVEKYEGVNAFKWIEETITGLLPTPPPQPKIKEEEPEEEEEIEEEEVVVESKPLAISSLKPPVPEPQEPDIPQGDKIVDLDREKEQEEAKKSVNSSGSSLMAQAMAMQKEREEN